MLSFNHFHESVTRASSLLVAAKTKWHYVVELKRVNSLKRQAAFNQLLLHLIFRQRVLEITGYDFVKWTMIYGLLPVSWTPR